MTTPTVTGVTTSSFAGQPWPPEVVAKIIDLLISGGPLAASLTRQQTTRSAIAWPIASPTGFAWLRELEEFPTVSLNDAAYVVALCKIGGIVDLSNESLDDASIDINAALGTLLADSLSRDLDAGLLNGSGPPEPVGILGVAPEVAGASLFAAAMNARGQIADAGGEPNTLAASGGILAAADGAVDSEGHQLFPNGVAAALGLTAVTVPELTTPLVYDARRCYLVVRDDATVETSSDFHFNLDATSMRIKARIAAAIPDVGKSIRKLDLTSNGGEGRRAEPARKA